MTLPGSAQQIRERPAVCERAKDVTHVTHPDPPFAARHTRTENLGVQEDAGNMEGAVQTLEAALEWWRHSMIDAPGSGAHPEHWLLQRLVQVPRGPAVP